MQRNFWGQTVECLIKVGPNKLDMVASFCYMAHMLSIGRRFELAVSTHVNTTRRIFRELLPALSSRHPSNKSCGHVYSPCAWSTILHASETWPVTKPNLQLLQHTARSCSDRSSISCLRIWPLFREIWLNYFGQVERSSGAFSQHVINTSMEGAGKRGGGGGKMTWKQLTENDWHEWKLNVQQSITKKK